MRFLFRIPSYVIVATHPRRSPNVFLGLTLIPDPLPVQPAPAMSASTVTKSLPYLAISLPPCFFSSNSFPCHRSEKSPAKSNHCHTSKVAQNNPCSCHTSETPLGVGRILLTRCPARIP